jgi:hypothetical protein
LNLKLYDTVVTNIYDTTYITVMDTTYISIYDTSLVSVTDTLIIDVVLSGVTPLNNINTVKIYPNPANTYVYINTGDYIAMNGYSIRIDNSLGQSVFSTSITQQQYYIDLSGWSGLCVYFVYIIDNIGNNVDVRKIILQ